MTKQIAVIKTGWCDSYNGSENVQGNFEHLLEGGDRAESFNMLKTKDGYQVYTMPKGGRAPDPSPKAGWLIYHVARDPAEQKMKLVGWYEDAEFIGKYGERSDRISKGVAHGYDGSSYCIVAPKAFEILPADRPVIQHDHRFGSSSVFWLSGNEKHASKEPWDKLIRRLAKAADKVRPAMIAPERIGRDTLGDTRKKPSSTDGVEVDDGGEVTGRSPIAESPEHMQLRLWASENPNFFGANAKSQSGTETYLKSGDRIDATHIGEDVAHLIEVKSRKSGEADIGRGIYQCLKYRAVFAKMDGSPKVSNIHAILLTEKALSQRMEVLAARLNVTCKIYEGFL
jgi:hypothetical protein